MLIAMVGSTMNIIDTPHNVCAAHATSLPRFLGPSMAAKLSHAPPLPYTEAAESWEHCMQVLQYLSAYPSFSKA